MRFSMRVPCVDAASARKRATEVISNWHKMNTRKYFKVISDDYESLVKIADTRIDRIHELVEEFIDRGFMVSDSKKLINQSIEVGVLLGHKNQLQSMTPSEIILEKYSDVKIKEHFIVAKIFRHFYGLGYKICLGDEVEKPWSFSFCNSIFCLSWEEKISRHELYSRHDETADAFKAAAAIENIHI